MRDRPTAMNPTTAASGIKDDVKNVDDKINLIAQKIKTIEKNQEIIGRTLIALNDKIEKVSKIIPNIGGGQNAFDDKKLVTREEFMELKAVIEQINPFEYATISEVKELVDEKIEKALQKHSRGKDDE